MDKRKEFADVSAAYGELEKSEPGPELDQTILRAAQDELDTAEKAARGDFWQQWLKPLSTVAVLGVCLTVVLQVMDNTPTMAPAASKARPEPADLEMSGAPAAEDMNIVRREQAAPAPEVQFEQVVTAKRQKEALQDMPASASAYSADEIMVTTRLSESKMPLAPNALTAWNKGARPAPDVWRSGIEYWREDRDPAEIDQELAKLQIAAADAQAENIDAIASTWAWSAGIDLLYENGDDERAEAELARYRQIYMARPGE